MPWYYYKSGRRGGPIDDAVMRHMAALGELEPTDLVWSPGMKEWAPAATVPGLLEPPPMPVSPLLEGKRSGLGGPSVLPAPTAAFAPTPAPDTPQAESEPSQAELLERHVTQETGPPQQVREEEPTTPSLASRGGKCPKCASLLPETALFVENNHCPACGAPVSFASNREAQSPAEKDRTPSLVVPGQSSIEEGTAVEPNMQEATNSSTTARKTSRTWMVSLGVVCLAIVAYGYMYSKNTENSLPFLIGYNLPMGLVIWGIFHAALGRQESKKNAALSFLAIYCSLIGSGLLGYWQQKLAARQLATEIQKGVSSFTSAATNAQGFPQRTKENLDTTPTTKGEFGEMERFMKTFMNQLTSQRNDYLRELYAIGWDKILYLERIKKDRNLLASKMMIQGAKDIVGKYRVRSKILLENARKDINNLNMSEASRRRMLAGFDRSMTESRSQIHDSWNLEAETITEVENIFALLSARTGAWVVQGGKIVFASEGDLRTFNSYLASIQHITSKQEATGKQSAESLNDTLNRLKN